MSQFPGPACKLYYLHESYSYLGDESAIDTAIEVAIQNTIPLNLDSISPLFSKRFHKVFGLFLLLLLDLPLQKLYFLCQLICSYHFGNNL